MLPLGTPIQIATQSIQSQPWFDVARAKAYRYPPAKRNVMQIHYCTYCLDLLFTQVCPNRKLALGSTQLHPGYRQHRRPCGEIEVITAHIQLSIAAVACHVQGDRHGRYRVGPCGSAHTHARATDPHPGNHARNTEIDPHARRINMQRSEEHTSELQSLMRISYAVFCLKKKNTYDSTKTHQP